MCGGIPATYWENHLYLYIYIAYIAYIVRNLLLFLMNTIAI